MKIDKILDSIYTAAIILALFLFFFGHVEGFGIDKLFYVPCAVAFITDLLRKPVSIKYGRNDYVLAIFIFLTLSSTIINPRSGLSLSSPFVRFIFGILCFIGIRKINIMAVISGLSYLSIPVIFLYYKYSTPFSVDRYSGFYGDPNYLAMAFNILVAVNTIFILTKKNIILKVMALLNILCIIPLIIAGASRGGFIALIILLLSISIYLYIYERKYLLILLPIILIFGSSYFALFSEKSDYLFHRFAMEERGDKNAAEARFNEIKAGLHVLKLEPYLLLLGVGIGNTDNPNRQLSGYYHKYRIHNSYFSILIEQGIFSFIAFCYLLVSWFKVIRKNKENFLAIRLGLFFSILLSASTVNSMSFLAFWWGLFFVQNPFSINTGIDSCDNNADTNILLSSA